jgi:hypothetical protein
MYNRMTKIRTASAKEGKGPAASPVDFREAPPALAVAVEGVSHPEGRAGIVVNADASEYLEKELDNRADEAADTIDECAVCSIVKTFV